MTTDTRETLAIGSWSSGSMRTEEWAAAALDMAGSVDEFNVEHDTDCADLAQWLDTGHINVTTDEHECECDLIAADLLDALISALDDYAPIYCYVGAHPGDGADFGIWLHHDALEEAIRNGTRVEDYGNGGGRYVNVEDGVIIDISDHGDVAVWEIAAGRALLAIV